MEELEKDCGDSSMIVLNINGEKEVMIVKKYLTRVPESKLARYFSGEEDLSPWIVKEAPNRYFIREHP